MPRSMSIRDIENLRKLRTRAPRDLSIASAAASLARQVRVASTRAVGVQEQWGSLVPEAIQDSCKQVALTKGTLTIRATSAAAAAAIQKWLASGGEALVRAGVSGVRAIRVVAR